MRSKDRHITLVLFLFIIQLILLTPFASGKSTSYSMFEPFLDLSVNASDTLDKEKIRFMKNSAIAIKKDSIETWQVMFIVRTTEYATEVIDKIYHLGNNLPDLTILYYSMQDDNDARDRWVNTKINYIFHNIDINFTKLKNTATWYKEVNMVGVSNEIEKYLKEANIILNELKTNLEQKGIYSPISYSKPN